ncbi:MAG: hypothetical protein UY72_C0009G0009 [Candidatus Uhrbacteria bacterium GW2011_GWD2_52_7]|uniref:Uncharacterized protein n=1 Tax=Candidatus Uhrbacteria bacterium GW2011_GWD2_52_7 TaxID=1618989 RepID=A0A0G1XHV8_9BACT|nr:MAG: hypothetical protein UY72_C0009G0009 [Candidatus Uhrbacteria bacterium GW2011_GWD2_52_7]
MQPHLRLINTDRNAPSTPTWRPGEKIVTVLKELDEIGFIFLAAQIGVAIYRAETIFGIVCLMLLVGTTLGRHAARDPIRLCIGYALIVTGFVLSAALLEPVRACIILLVAITQFLERGLEILREHDRDRLIQALAANRRFTSPYGNPAFEERIVKEFTDANLRNGLDAEIRSLAMNRRMTFTILNRHIRVTTDKEAKDFGADALEAHFRDVANPKFIVRTASRFAAATAIAGLMYSLLAFFT